MGKREFQIIRIVLVGNRKGMIIEPRKREEKDGLCHEFACLAVLFIVFSIFYVCVTRKRTRTRKEGEAERKGEWSVMKKGCCFRRGQLAFS